MLLISATPRTPTGAGSSATEHPFKNTTQVARFSVAPLEGAKYSLTIPKRPLSTSFGKLVGILPLIAKLVIFAPLLRVRQNLVGLVYLLKFGLSRLVARIDIRMMLSGQPAISLLYLLLRGIPTHTKYLIIILRHINLLRIL
jgi:hypothetical protein